MIISATRIKTSSGTDRVGAHVFDGAGNEEIFVVSGDRAELDDMLDDAVSHGAKYAIRHYSVSPKVAMTRDEALEIVADLGKEFGFDPTRAVVVEHCKKRAADGGYDRHWHALVPEVDPIRCRVLSDSWMCARHERIARAAELRLGHELTAGRFNSAVVRAMRADKQDAAADQVAKLVELDRPLSGFTAAAHQTATRQGRSIPGDRAIVCAAWARSDSRESFVAALSENGLTLNAGRKAGVFIVERAGGLIGSVDRLIGEKKSIVNGRLAVPASTYFPSTVMARSIAARATEVGGSLSSSRSPMRTPLKSGKAQGAAIGGGGVGRLIRPIDPSAEGDAARFLREFADWLAEIQREAAIAQPTVSTGGYRPDAEMIAAQIAAIRQAVISWLDDNRLAGDVRAQHVAAARRAARAAIEGPQSRASRIAKHRVNEAEARILGERPPARPKPMSSRISADIEAERERLRCEFSDASFRVGVIGRIAAIVGIRISKNRVVDELAHAIHQLDESVADQFRRVDELDRAAQISWAATAEKWRHRQRDRVADLARVRAAVEEGDALTIADVIAGHLNSAVIRLRKMEERRRPLSSTAVLRRSPTEHATRRSRGVSAISP